MFEMFRHINYCLIGMAYAAQRMHVSHEFGRRQRNFGGLSRFVLFLMIINFENRQNRINLYEKWRKQNDTTKTKPNKR